MKTGARVTTGGSEHATMGRGIRAQVSVGDPGPCPLAPLSDEGTVISDVSWCECATGTVCEWTAPAGTVQSAEREDVSVVYELNDRGRYRLTAADPLDDGPPESVTTASDGGDRCPCEVLEARGQPVADLRAEGGSVSLTFYAPTVAGVRDVVDALRSRFDAVSLRKLHRGDDGAADDPTTVDRGRLTARQREALRTAHEMGYFARQRDATGEEVADALGISLSTFTEHVGAGLDKLLAQLFDGR